MRAALRRQLDTQFKVRFNAAFPMFNRLQMSKSEPSIWAACKTLRSLTFFIMIVPLEKEDSFALEIAWSENGPFPWDSIGMAPDLTLQRWRGRVGQLFVPPRDSIWELDPEYRRAGMRWLAALERGKPAQEPSRDSVSNICQHLPSAINDVAKTIENHAIPYFFAIQKLCGSEVLA